MVNKILHRKLKIEIHYNQEMTPSVTSEKFINVNEAMGTCTIHCNKCLVDTKWVISTREFTEERLIIQWQEEKRTKRQTMVDNSVLLHRKLRSDITSTGKYIEQNTKDWTTQTRRWAKYYSLNYRLHLSEGLRKVLRYQRDKGKKDRQYNDNKENRQNDKHWSTKHYTENYDRTSRVLVNA
jgi:hypothetical protein